MGGLSNTGTVFEDDFCVPLSEAQLIVTIRHAGDVTKRIPNLACVVVQLVVDIGFDF